MKILHSWLKDYVLLEESPRRVAEILSLHAFETSVVKNLTGNDAVLEVDLFPNRVRDASSHVGIARELAAILRKRLMWKPAKVKESSKKTSDFISVVVGDNNLCSRYSMRVISGVKVGHSPMWLKKRLLACGLRPINSIVDVTNYVMLELGEPLHAFDYEKIKNINHKPEAAKHKTVFVRRAKTGEVIDALDEKRYALEASDLVIADAVGPLAIAGIKGGKRAEIDKNTNILALEAANFDATTIRQTSKRLGLRTDSSWRFENTMDPNMTVVALNRAAELIVKIAGGNISKGIVDAYPQKFMSRTVAVDVGSLESLIGRPVSALEIIRLLKPMIEEGKIVGDKKLLLRPITARHDLQHPEDIAEEVARLLGYEGITSKPLMAGLALPFRNESFEFRETLRDRFVAIGFSEVYNYFFLSPQKAKDLRFDTSKMICLENPLSSDATYLQPDLLPGILKNIRDNFRFFDEVRIFEIGKRILTRDGGAREEWMLSFGVSRKEAKAKDIFFEAKGCLESLLESFGLDKDDYAFLDYEDDRFVKSCAALLKIGKEQVGKVGILQPRLMGLCDIDAFVVYSTFEINALLREVMEEREYEPFSKFPDIIRDISVLSHAGLRVHDIDAAIAESGANYLSDVDLFDVYEGEELASGKISMSFHLIFRAANRTLTDGEVEVEMSKITKALRRLGAEMR